MVTEAITTDKREVSLMEFSTWLMQELERRGWSNSELARRAEVVPSTISMIISGSANPGVDACLGIARAFNEDPVKVFRLAGLLPALSTRKEIEEEILNLFYELSDQDQARLIVIARAWALESKQKRKRGNPGTPTEMVTATD